MVARRPNMKRAIERDTSPTDGTHLTAREFAHYEVDQLRR